MSPFSLSSFGFRAISFRTPSLLFLCLTGLILLLPPNPHPLLLSFLSHTHPPSLRSRPMAYYASTSTSQYYYQDQDHQKGYGDSMGEEEARGRQPFSYISHDSSVSDSYGGGAYGYSSQQEEDEGSNQSEELIFDMDPEDSTYNSPEAEEPPTPTYPITPSTASSSSSYFDRRTEQQPPPPSEDSAFQGGFNRASATSQESLADMLLNECRQEFRTAGENGVNLWVTQRLRSLVDFLSSETITSRARGQEEVQATMALLNFFHVNLQISTAYLLPEIRRWRVGLYWSGLAESAEAAGDEW
ncbi:hypothetical protein BDY24DRAFT_376005 [Mrakia frigida]|uniref:uncharacterized protein n=1 Tax=Mrakia frigida TaxID=29902 RepID=UPI003FCC1114